MTETAIVATVTHWVNVSTIITLTDAIASSP